MKASPWLKKKGSKIRFSYQSWKKLVSWKNWQPNKKNCENRSIMGKENMQLEWHYQKIKWIQPFRPIFLIYMNDLKSPHKSLLPSSPFHSRPPCLSTSRGTLEFFGNFGLSLRNNLEPLYWFPTALGVSWIQLPFWDWETSYEEPCCECELIWKATGVVSVWKVSLNLKDNNF